jgi:hypothetical protein
MPTTGLDTLAVMAVLGRKDVFYPPD